MELKYKLAEGKLAISLKGAQLDKDQDGKKAIEAVVEINIELAELLNEITGKNTALVEVILQNVKLGN